MNTDKERVSCRVATFASILFIFVATMHFGFEILTLCAAVLLGGLAGWIFLGRVAFRFFDRFFLVVIGELPITPIELRERDFAIGRQIWPFPRDEGPIHFEVRMDEKNRLILWKYNSGFFWFGTVNGVRAGRDGKPGEFLFEPDAGDRVSMTQAYSRLAWPVPFEVSILGGSVSRWRRHLYDRLVWEKSYGQRLEIVWRHGQHFYKGRGWADDWNLRLARIRVGVIPFEKIAGRYLRKTKGWDIDSYRLEFRGKEGVHDVVAAIHRDDENSSTPGAGKSVVLTVDLAAKKVTREIGGQ